MPSTNTESLFGPACNRPWGQLWSLPGRSASAVREPDLRFRNTEGCGKNIVVHRPEEVRGVLSEGSDLSTWLRGWSGWRSFFSKSEILWLFCCWLYSSWSPGEVLSLSLSPSEGSMRTISTTTHWVYLKSVVGSETFYPVYIPFWGDFLRRTMISSF